MQKLNSSQSNSSQNVNHRVEWIANILQQNGINSSNDVIAKALSDVTQSSKAIKEKSKNINIDCIGILAAVEKYYEYKVKYKQPQTAKIMSSLLSNALNEIFTNFSNNNSEVISYGKSANLNPKRLEFIKKQNETFVGNVQIGALELSKYNVIAPDDKRPNAVSLYEDKSLQGDGIDKIKSTFFYKTINDFITKSIPYPKQPTDKTLISEISAAISLSLLQFIIKGHNISNENEATAHGVLFQTFFNKVNLEGIQNALKEGYEQAFGVDLDLKKQDKNDEKQLSI